MSGKEVTDIDEERIKKLLRREQRLTVGNAALKKKKENSE